MILSLILCYGINWGLNNITCGAFIVKELVFHKATQILKSIIPPYSHSYYQSMTKASGNLSNFNFNIIISLYFSN